MTLILKESTTTHLSVAVELLDDFNGKRPLGQTEVSLDGKKAINNPSGYFLFLDYPAGNHQLKIDNKYYFPHQENISVPNKDHLLKSITLKPKPSYPFPVKSTLIRGVVMNSDKKPVLNSTIEITGTTKTYTTTATGEFIFYFGPFKESEIIKVNKTRYVKINGSRDIQLKVTHADYAVETITKVFEEGKTTSLTIIVH